MTEQEYWYGGALPSQDIQSLINEGQVQIGYDRADIGIQPASLDLSLGSVAYRLQASFLPQGNSVRERMEDLIMYEINLEKGAILEKGAVYLIPLRERLALPNYIKGKTNPKSSIGRLDVFTRVITDYCARFEDVASNYKGELFLEVVPRSFTIKVKTGQRLNQLRLFEIAPQADNSAVIAPYEKRQGIGNSDLTNLYTKEKLLYGADENFIEAHHRHLSDNGLLMSIDLSSANMDGGPIGFMAKKNSQVIDLEKIAHYDAEDFWEAIHTPKDGRLILEPEEFYIFASKERIRVPLNCAAEMVEFDAGSGELRTHYAGFFDPGFGYGKNGEVKGTKAVLEVRPHDVPFIIEDGQILFKMKYERMASEPDIWYGEEIGSNYHNQTLRLSKQFRQ
ncbi:Deoxycytidine triphosphate deaminase [hydrothermal vent metagenome]|uniref:Deoxycytidine triphosphate deaminase n=1 Tax=hydrothermal vent metagenome TaxID=652676 RepID=A0A3B1C2M9_9ZZZZ